MTISVIAAADSDDVVIAWSTDGKIDGCLGFAIERIVGKDSTFLETEVGFAGDPKPKADPNSDGLPKESSEIWPIQRFVWTDHDAPDGVAVTYTVHAMMGVAGNLTRGISGTTPKSVTRATNSSEGYSLFPNRGIVAAPWIEHSIQQAINASNAPKPSATKVLATSIAATGNHIRTELSGPVLIALRKQFEDAAAAGEDLYLALYELRDEELIDLLISAGPRLHLILGNGSYTTTGKHPDLDPNKPAADKLEAAGLTVKRRIVTSPHFAHNKFIVFAKDGVPTRVWTGSTNWTPSGLCTQANHAIVVEDNVLAQKYLDYWNRLEGAGSSYPASLAATDSTATSAAGPKTRAWFAPVKDHVDLADARSLIDNAKQGALFLMFRPGNTHTLVDEIEKLHDRGLFIRGVVNTNFLGPETSPTIEFFDSEATSTKGDPEVILPNHLQKPTGPFDAESGVQGVLIHSKIVVVDPFGENPVIMTGSHNLGEKASADNDDNLLIIQNQSGLAAEFAVYIMNVYDHYKWRYELGVRAAKAKTSKVTPAKIPAGATPTTGANKPWDGLSKSADDWQSDSYLAAAAIQAKFWFAQ